MKKTISQWSNSYQKSKLGLSKVFMQNFLYNYIKNKCGDEDTDTDSLMYKIVSENAYEDFYNGKELFDFNNYPVDFKYYNNANNLVVSKMKDETCSVLIKSFVGLMSKMYTFITEENNEYKKVEGVNKKLLMMN